MSNISDFNYSNIPNPYDSNLVRASVANEVVSPLDLGTQQDYVNASEGQKASSIGQAGTAGKTPVSSLDQQLGNLWINTWIKSRNYKPKSQGFFFDGALGYIEAMKLYIGSGGIVGGKLDIPDTTSANSFHVNTTGDAWWGSAAIDTAVAKILKTGVATFTAVNISGLQPGSEIDGTYILANTIGSAAANLALRDWSLTCAFSATSSTVVTWGSGSLILSDGTVYSINTGNTGTLAARAYIYFDLSVSTTTLQVTYTAADAVGNGKLLVATAINDTDSALFQVFGGVGGITVNANSIAANAITANKISVTNLAAISANLGTITAANVTVGTSGWLRGGQTDYNTGVGFFLGASGGVYKFSIGDPSGNYMTWDNSYLRIKGNFELASVLNMISFTVANLPIPPSTAGFNNPGGWE